MPVKDFLNLVLVFQGYLLGMVISSTNDKGYPLFKNTRFKKLSSSRRFVQSEEILNADKLQCISYQICIPLAKNYQNGYTCY